MRRVCTAAVMVLVAVAAVVVAGPLDAAAPAPNDAVSCHLAWTTNWQLGTIAQLDVDAGTFSPTIAVTPHARHLAVNPQGTTAVVAGDGGGVVAVDLDTGAVASPIPVTGDVSAIAFLPDGQHALVAASPSVVPIDLTSNTAGTPIPVAGATDLAVTHDGTRAVVTTSAGVDIIDVATGTVTATIPLPGAVAVAVAATDVAFVATDVQPFYDAYEVTLATSAVGPGAGLTGHPGHVAVTPDSTFWLATTWDTLTPLNAIGVGTTGVAAPILPPGSPGFVADHLAVSADGAMALVGDDDAHLLHPFLANGGFRAPISNGPFTAPTSPIDIAFAQTCTTRYVGPTATVPYVPAAPGPIPAPVKAVSATPTFTG